MRPNPARAKSLVRMARRDIALAITLTADETTSPTIIRNIYEGFRMLGEARLALAGIRSADHKTQLKELERLKITTKRPLGLLERFRKIRNAINYDGEPPELKDAMDAQDFAKQVFDDCAHAIEEEIES